MLSCKNIECTASTHAAIIAWMSWRSALPSWTKSVVNRSSKNSSLLPSKAPGLHPNFSSPQQGQMASNPLVLSSLKAPPIDSCSFQHFLHAKCEHPEHSLRALWSCVDSSDSDSGAESEWHLAEAQPPGLVRRAHVRVHRDAHREVPARDRGQSSAQKTNATSRVDREPQH